MASTDGYYDNGEFVAMTMGQFCQLIIDAGPLDAVLFRVVHDEPVNDKSFIREMSVFLVPDGSIAEAITETGARVHKILAGMLENGFVK